MYRNIILILLVTMLIPFNLYGEQNTQVRKVEDFFTRYSEFVKEENEALNSVFHECVYTKPTDLECVENTNQMRFFLYESVEEVETFAVIYKSLVHGQECFDNDFKVDIYSALSGARINFSRNYEQIKELCLNNKAGKYLKARCEGEAVYVDEFVEITDFILKNAESYIKFPVEN